MDESSQQSLVNTRQSLNGLKPPNLSPSGSALISDKNVIWRIVFYLILNEMNDYGNQSMEELNPNLNDIYKVLKIYLDPEMRSFGRNPQNSFSLELQTGFSNGFVLKNGFTFSQVQMKSEEWTHIGKVREKREKRENNKGKFMEVKKLKGVQKGRRMRRK